MERVRKEVRTNLGNRRQFRVSPSNSLHTSVPSLKISSTEAHATSLKHIGKKSVANLLHHHPTPSQKSVVASPPGEVERRTQRPSKSRGNLSVERAKMPVQRTMRERQNPLLDIRMWVMTTGKRRSRRMVHGTLMCRRWIRLRRTTRGSYGRI